MNGHKAAVICSILIILSICFTAGCGKTKSAPSKPAYTSIISETELKSIESSGKLFICYGLKVSEYTPQNQNAVMSKVMSWLKQTKIYKGKVPDSNDNDFNAYVGPARLVLCTPDNHEINIYPAYYYQNSDNKIHYVDNVLIIRDNKQKYYIECSQIFNWLKNDEWKSEFKSL